MGFSSFVRFFRKKRSKSSSSASSSTSKRSKPEVSDEERNRIWDQKIKHQQYLARAEEREIEEAERKKDRDEKIKLRDERLLREIKDLDRKGTEAVKKITKTGKKAAKGFAKDMLGATKIAAKGLGDWADRVVPDEKPKAKRKTKTAAKKVITKSKTSIRKKPKFSGNKRGLPEYVTINGKRYTRAGTFGNDAAKARNYALSLRANGLDAKVKKMTNGVISLWTVWYRSKAATTTVRKRRKRKANNSWC